MKLSVVIPMYNEESIVADTISVLDASLERHFGADEYEMIFVSDGSKDKCLDIASSMKDKYKALKVLGYEVNKGKGCAVRTGMLEAQGDFVLFTDCDLAYGTDIIKVFYDKYAEKGSDIVIGSRALNGGGYDGYSFLRKAMSMVYLRIVGIVAGFKLSDSQCGIKGFANGYASRIFSLCQADGFEFDLEALMIGESFGCSFAEIPVKIINHRESKVNPIKDSVKMLRQIRNIKKRHKQRLKDGTLKETSL